MRLSLQSDYALRTLMYLAVQQRRVTIDEVATFFGISAAHVAKVVNLLARLSYVRSIRGIGGGFELHLQPDEIFVGEVILAVEGDMHLLECVGGEQICVIQPFCRLKGVLAEAERRQMDYLRSVTLREVLPKERDLVTIAGQRAP